MKRARADFLVLAALVAAGFVLGRIQTIERKAGAADPATRTIRRVLAPGSAAMASVAGALADFGSAVAHGRSLESENRRLRAVAATAATYQQDLDRLERELAEVRRLAGWEAHGRKKIPADVVGLFPDENRITLNVGSRQGVRRGMPVATYEGLVGRIETVDVDSSQALLITAPGDASRMTVLVRRQPPNPWPAGVLRGAGGNALQLDMADPTAPIDTGDTVVTSGFSDEIPRGLVVGRIVSVQDDPAFGRRSATVFPAVSLGSVREVLVIE